ncbi:protein DBF4 homolog B-like [Oratosquilla oratoria]|uniref:protein DBF4 homolog B-like n=1 Tax=Oratosquilla oratoria TaxID=337810 RepID=UPI003F7715D3
MASATSSDALTHSTVEEFLTREVSYVITTKPLLQAGSGRSSEVGNNCQNPQKQHHPQSPAAISPLTPQLPSSVPSTSQDSPSFADSPREDKKRVRTRAEVLLERACVRRRGTSDILENARQWNVPVWPLQKLLKWLQGLKDSGKYRPQRTHTASKGQTLTPGTRVYRLKSPYLKIEAFSRQSKPLYKELGAWPLLNLAASPGTSPFAPVIPAEPVFSPKSVKAKISSHKDDLKDKGKRKERKNNKESGYCELCSANYTNLRLHLQSDAHVAFVRNGENYAHLDQLIKGHGSEHTNNVSCRLSCAVLLVS